VKYSAPGLFETEPTELNKGNHLLELEEGLGSNSYGIIVII